MRGIVLKALGQASLAVFLTFGGISNCLANPYEQLFASLPARETAMVVPPGLVPVGEEWITEYGSTTNNRAFYRSWVKAFSVTTPRFATQVAKPWPTDATIVTVVLNRDGQIQDIELLRSSGSKQCDDLVLEGVRGSGPFPPVPKRLSHLAAVKLIVPFGVGMAVTPNGESFAFAETIVGSVEQYQFHQAIAQRLTNAVRSNDRTSRSSWSARIEFDISRGHIVATRLGEGTGNASIDQALLSAAVAIGTDLSGPDGGEGNLATVIVPVSFRPQPAKSAAPGRAAAKH